MRRSARKMRNISGLSRKDQMRINRSAGFFGSVGAAVAKTLRLFAHCSGKRVASSVLLCFGLSTGLPAQTQSSDLAGESLEELMNTQVTSVSKKEQKLSSTPAAVYVINQEDIRRSGASNIPDLLRMVPGVDVAQIDGGHWAISIRGFSDLFSDKVLVLVDGRSAYRPTFAGVSWDEMDMPLENIERMEVIRGPGGTVWGANAMNGVINIITKSSLNTQGGLVIASAGSQNTEGGLLQYGGLLGSSGTYRVFEKYFNTGNAVSAGQLHAADGSHGVHEGFRTDWSLSQRDALTVEGEVVQTDGGESLLNIPISAELPLTKTFNSPVKYSSGNILARWSHTTAGGSDMSLQLYDDYYVKRELGTRESVNTVDLDFTNHLAVGSRHDLVWGFGYRSAASTLTAGYYTAFQPPKRTDQLANTFLQDEITLTGSLSLTLGAKFEYNSYTAFEFEPSALLAWSMNSRHTFWISAARAIRQPARRDVGTNADFQVLPLGNGSFGVMESVGALNVLPEKMRDLEIGHRAQINRRLSVDSVAFLSYYSQLATYEVRNPFIDTTATTTHLVFPVFQDFIGRAHNYGVEFFATWNVNRRWKLSPGFSTLHINLLDPPGANPDLTEGSNPKHTFEVRSALNLRRNLEWDASFSSVGALTGVPGCLRLNTRLGWRLGESFELSVVGQNLLSPAHPEFTDEDFIAHTLVARNVSAKITWRF
jgi:iron complex outermembrane receptor protein